MSKVKKVVVKKLSEHRISISNTNSNNLANTHSLKYIQDRPEQLSESPYNSRLTFARSKSTLKENPFQTMPNINSTPVQMKKHSANKSTQNLSISFVNNKDHLIRASSNKRPSKISIMENTNHELETKLDELEKSQQENGIDSELFEKYEQCFDDIIKNDKVFGSALGKIKVAYKNWMSSKALQSAENKKLKSEIFEFSKKLTEEIEENKQLHRKVQKFSRENVEMGRSLEEKDTNFKMLQEYLLKITNMNIDEIPVDIASWKVLVSENKSYSELCAKLKAKIKRLNQKEKKLMNLFWAMKQKGYPVEKMYDKMEKKNSEAGSVCDKDERMTRRSSKGSSFDLNRIRNSSNEDNEVT